MVGPVKVTNGQKMFDQLEKLFDGVEEPGEFQLRLLKKDAERLINADAGEGYIALAAIEALRWNSDEAARLARNAVRLDTCIETLMNAALTMRNIHNMELANEFMQTAVALNPPNPIARNRAVAYLVFAGHIQEAAKLMMDSIDLGVSFRDVPNAIEMLASLERVGVSPAQVQLEFAAVSQTLLGHKKRVHSFYERLVEDPDGGLSVVATFETYGSVDDEIYLEHDLSSRLSDLENWNPVKFSVELVCVMPYADQAKRAA